MDVVASGDETLEFGVDFTEVFGPSRNFGYEDLVRVTVPAEAGGVTTGFLGQSGLETVYICTAADPANGVGYTLISDAPTVVCSLPGTRIGTPDADVSVERLSIGDPILTADGRVVPIIWLGRQTVSALFGLTEGRRRVRITARTAA